MLIALTDRPPTRSPTCSSVKLNWSRNLRYAVAVSRGFRSARCRFSMSESSKRCWLVSVRTNAGTLSTPAIFAARQRRSPATIIYLPPFAVTTIGWSIPCTRIESASSPSDTSSKRRRGWSGSGIISSILILRKSLTFSSWSAVGSKDSSNRSVGIKESNDRPSPFLNAMLSYPFHHLFCHRFICSSTFTKSIVYPYRHTMAWCFCQSYVPRNSRFKNFSRKMLGDFCKYLLTQ